MGKMKGFISDSARIQLRDMVVTADPTIIGKTVDVSMLATANIDSAYKGQVDLSSSRGAPQGEATSRLNGSRSTGL
jgi:hypothetical protein